MQMVLHGQCMHPWAMHVSMYCCMSTSIFSVTCVYVAAFTNFYECYFHKTGFGEKLNKSAIKNLPITSVRSFGYTTQRNLGDMPHIETICTSY